MRVFVSGSVSVCAIGVCVCLVVYNGVCGCDSVCGRVIVYVCVWKCICVYVFCGGMTLHPVRTWNFDQRQ